jgi:hypothetical protein
MRLWSLHPRYLDSRGLVALWREGLLAQAVLLGGTRGYRHHPQLARFREQPDPLACIGEYLRAVQEEATDRGYSFAAERISHPGPAACRLTVSRGQLAFEWRHLLVKLAGRDPLWLQGLSEVRAPGAHPLFRVVPGGVASWERGASAYQAERS